MFAILAALILRPVAFKYRSKRESPRWRSTWDWCLFIGGAVPALLFGVAIGNVLLGVPFELTPDLFTRYEGAFHAKFIGLLSPFAVLTGLVSLSMLITHGAAWLSFKTEGEVASRARTIGSVSGLIFIAGYVLSGVWLASGIEGYALVGEAITNGPSNPLYSEVMRTDTWFVAYSERPWIAVAPILGLLGAVMAVMGLRAGREGTTLLWSKLGIVGTISSVGLTMFPFLLPSSIDPRSSLTVWDSSSSHQTLFVMLVATTLFMPLILAYTAWVYRVLWGKVTAHDVTNSNSAY